MAQRPRIPHSSSRITQSYLSFENDAIVQTFNAYAQAEPSENVTRVERCDHHSLVKSQLKKLANGSESYVGSCEMKTPTKLPPCTDDPRGVLAGFMKRILHSYNTMFDDNGEVRSAMLGHVLRSADPTAEDDALEEGRFAKCFLDCLHFGDMAAFTDAHRGWTFRSYIGTCEFSGREVARKNAGCELDWSRQADGFHSLRESMELAGVPVWRYLIVAAGAGGTFVLDTVCLPTSASLQHRLNVGVTRLKGSPDPAHWTGSTFAIRSEFFHPRHGSTPFNAVSLHCPDIMEHARRISLLHIGNQAMREILRMRAEPSEAVQKLVSPQRGKYLKSEARMAELDGLLKRELTAEERAEFDAWMGKALRYRQPQLACTRGSMTRNFIPQHIEASNIGASIQMGYGMSLKCQTPPFRGRSISLDLGNTWEIEHSNLTFLTAH